MMQLFKYYELIKEEFKTDNYLMSCNDMYQKSRYRSEISSHLKEIGFKCSADQESTLFFSLVDIVVVVDKNDNFYFATMCEQKLLELKNLGRLLPKNGETDYSKVSSLVSLNTLDTINEYLGKTKFHFIKLNRLKCNSFFCNITSMNPYPRLKDCRLYSVDCMQKVYENMCSLLLRGMYVINNIVCTTSPIATSYKNINTCVMDCRLNVKTIDGLFEEFYLWNIICISNFYQTKTVGNLLSGVCKYKNQYFTLNREILERFYGSTYLEFESQGVRERYCLEDLYDITSTADLRYYISKYKFYRDKEICSCKNIFDLRELLRSRMIELPKYDNCINARILITPGVLWGKHTSYYHRFSVNTEFESVQDIDSVMPQVYKVSGVSSLGYYFVEVKATSWGTAESLGKKEFIRQFGSLYKDKVLGVQRGNEIEEHKHKVYQISIDTQRKICELMRWGYIKQYDDYSRCIRSILSTQGICYDISDDMLKLLLVNNIAKQAGKCQNVSLEIVGTELETFIHFLTTHSEEDVIKKLDKVHKSLNKGGKK